MAEKYKTLVLKKTYFPDGYNGSMEQVVAGIIQNLPNHNDRIYQADLLRTYRLAQVDTPANGSGTFVRLTASEAGPTGIINLQKSDQTIDVEEHSPPENSEFLNEEVMLFIANNHIIACNLGNRDSLVHNIICTLGIKAGVLASDFAFKVSDVANKTEIEKIQEVGVKSIDLSVTSYLATFDKIADGTTMPGAGFVRKIFGTPADAENIRKRANTSGRLVLNRGRFKKEEIRKDAWLTDIGKTIIEGDIGEYTITLEDESKISNLKLKVTKGVKLKTFANSICPQHTKHELKSFYDELQANKALEW